MIRLALLTIIILEVALFAWLYYEALHAPTLPPEADPDLPAYEPDADYYPYNDAS